MLCFSLFSIFPSYISLLIPFNLTMILLCSCINHDCLNFALRENISAPAGGTQAPQVGLPKEVLSIEFLLRLLTKTKTPCSNVQHALSNVMLIRVFFCISKWFYYFSWGTDDRYLDGEPSLLLLWAIVAIDWLQFLISCLVGFHDLHILKLYDMLCWWLD